MKYKVLEPVLLLGLPRFALVDIRVRVSGGGYVAQIYGEEHMAALRELERRIADSAAGLDSARERFENSCRRCCAHFLLMQITEQSLHAPAAYC